MCARRTATSCGSRSRARAERGRACARLRAGGVPVGASRRGGRSSGRARQGLRAAADGLSGQFPASSRTSSARLPGRGGRDIGAGAAGMPDQYLSNPIRVARRRGGGRAPAWGRASPCPGRSAPRAERNRSRTTGHRAARLAGPSGRGFRGGHRRASGRARPGVSRCGSRSIGRERPRRRPAGPGDRDGLGPGAGKARRGFRDRSGSAEELPGASGQFSSNCRG